MLHQKRSTSQCGDCIQGSSFYHSELEVVGEQRHQEKYPGCMTTGKGITFFPPADNTRPIESKKGALPVHIRSDNGPEFIARILRKWLEELGVKTLFIEPGSPWENGYVESFNGKMQDELRNREIFYTLKEAQILIERWRKEYNTIRPNSSLGYRPPCYARRNPTLGSVSVVLDSGRNMLSQQRYSSPKGALPFGQIRADVSGITQTDFGYRAASP